MNDAFGASDAGDVLLLALLDLSAAFDVVDHNLLLKRLQQVGISGAALDWLKSYLTNRPADCSLWRSYFGNH